MAVTRRTFLGATAAVAAIAARTGRLWADEPADPRGDHVYLTPDIVEADPDLDHAEALGIALVEELV
jgi:hypothetical protein